MAITTPPTTKATSDTSAKGLATGKVGLIGAVVIGISCIAPTYTLTSGLGPTISAVGKYVPGILILGFLPMLLVAFAYRELNNAVPDSGTSFTWATKAFGPYVGWMGGWGLITATILVMSNLAAVAVDFFYLLIAQLTGNDAIADWTRNLWINIPTTIVFIAIAGWVSYRGLDSTKNLQYALVLLQIAAVVVFDVVAIRQALAGGGFNFTQFEFSWFNPLEIGSFSLIAAGISLSIFMFWGWDVTLTMNEETTNPDKTPRSGCDRDGEHHHRGLHPHGRGNRDVGRNRRHGTGCGQPRQPGVPLRSTVLPYLGHCCAADLHRRACKLFCFLAVHDGGPSAHRSGDGALPGTAARVREDFPDTKPQVPQQPDQPSRRACSTSSRASSPKTRYGTRSPPSD